MSLQCVNCNVRFFNMRRHALSGESEDLIACIRRWTYPRDITPTDQICHACWQLASNSASLQDMSTRQLGHRCICIVCGRSVLRKRRRKVLIEGANTEQERVANIVASWIQPRQLCSEDEVCIPCFLRAKRTKVNIKVEYIQLGEPADVDGDEDHSALMCAVCGQSVFDTECKVWNRENIERLLELLRTSSMNQVCAGCWAQAQHLSLTNGQQERVQQIELPNVRRAPDTGRSCIFRGCTEVQRNVISEKIRREVMIKYQYFIPRLARICSLHREEANFENLYTSEYSLDRFTPAHVEDIIYLLTEDVKNISYENIQTYPDNHVNYFIGLSKQQHAQILDATPRLKSMRRGSFALTALLCKLRTGDSGDRLSCLFNVSRRTLETLMSLARNILLTDFVPQYLGFSHLKREQVAARNSYIADHIFGEPDAPAAQKPAITIPDATYIYTQKSSNSLFERDTYSLYNNRNFLKPFVLCASDGYIIDVLGPYTANTNDATIMNELLNSDEFNDFYSENDVFILDKGFRDCMDSLHEKGYIGHMPESKKDGHSQLSTLEANKSCCVTISRSIVEEVNGRFKNEFKIFRQEYFNRSCRNLMTDFKIAAALLNAFTRPVVDNIRAEQFVSIIYDRLFLSNSLAEMVMEHSLNTRSSLFVPVDATTLSFPQLSIEDLKLFECGVSHFHRIHSLEVSRERVHGLEGINPMLLRAQIKPPKASAKIYFVFIVAETNMNGWDAIKSYCCDCIEGLRTVGCCSHVMSLVWFLSYARHRGGNN